MAEQQHRYRYDAGIAIRKKVMGEEYINSLLGVADGFYDEVQELATESSGAVLRPVPTLRDRSLIETSVMTAVPNQSLTSIRNPDKGA